MIPFENPLPVCTIEHSALLGPWESTEFRQTLGGLDSAAGRSPPDGHPVRRLFGLWNRREPAAEKPLRDELLSIERLEERALALAASFTVEPSPTRRSVSIFPRFDDNARVLRAAYRTLADDVRAGRFVSSASEWLLDNFHLVTSEIRDIRQNLPRTYYRELPMLASRDHVGRARIYAIAIELVRHSDSRLDRQQLTHFLNSYQRVAPLTIGELWAWPSMLKLALIENLRRLAEEALAARSERLAADAYVAQIDGSGAGASLTLPPLSHTAFVVELLHRVREYGIRQSPIRAAVEEHLVAAQTTAEDAIRREHQRQGLAQVSVANAITSLRFCATLDWQQYVEAVSLVEQVLKRDPAGAYGRMDFLSRDRQRQAIEELAASSGDAQLRVALRAVEMRPSGRRARFDVRSCRARRISPHRQGPARPRGRRGLQAATGQSNAPRRPRSRDHLLPWVGHAPDGPAPPRRRGVPPACGRFTGDADGRRPAAVDSSGGRGDRLHPASDSVAGCAETPAAPRLL